MLFLLKSCSLLCEVAKVFFLLHCLKCLLILLLINSLSPTRAWAFTAFSFLPRARVRNFLASTPLSNLTEFYSHLRHGRPLILGSPGFPPRSALAVLPPTGTCRSHINWFHIKGTGCDSPSIPWSSPFFHIYQMPFSQTGTHVLVIIFSLRLKILSLSLVLQSWGPLVILFNIWWLSALLVRPLNFKGFWRTKYHLLPTATPALMSSRCSFFFLTWACKHFNRLETWLPTLTRSFLLPDRFRDIYRAHELIFKNRKC